LGFRRKGYEHLGCGDGKREAGCEAYGVGGIAHARWEYAFRESRKVVGYSKGLLGPYRPPSPFVAGGVQIEVAAFD